ncbi:MAG: hypothetical protein Q8903_02400 [Bacteroidota bacterium]|nr:hypothetical protein [Bacteroidota bacterium]
MELIPILSTIILVATMMTFILAIGAYILYKVRERRGQHVAISEPSKVRAEIIAPLEMPEYEEIPAINAQPYYQPQQQVPFQQPQPYYVPQPGPAKQYYQQPSYGPQQQNYSGEYIETPKRNVVRRKTGNTEEKLRGNTSSRFLKYTSEGYVPPKEDKNQGSLKWR